MSQTASAATQTESVQEFAARARKWLAESMPSIDPNDPPEADRGEEAPWLRARELQRKLWDGGFAGICFPSEYGGLGLPIEYQRAFDVESRCYEMPIILNTPTFTICAATILDMGSEDQKRTHIAGALRGDRSSEIVERTLLTTRSVEFDAVVIAGGTAGLRDVKLTVLLQEAFRHCKPLAAWAMALRC